MLFNYIFVNLLFFKLIRSYLFNRNFIKKLFNVIKYIIILLIIINLIILIINI